MIGSIEMYRNVEKYKELIRHLNIICYDSHKSLQNTDIWRITSKI